MSRIDKTPVRVPGLAVEVTNDRFERAMRIFIKKVQESGRLQDLRQREFYEKPSERKKREASNARKRWLRQKEQDNPNITTRPR